MEPIFNKTPGWKRIYFDLPGMGKTKGEPWINNSDKVLDVVSAFVERIISDQHFLVVGESYGGYLARGLVFKQQKSIDGLMLICPVIEPEPERRTLPPPRVIVEDRRLLSELSPADAKEFAPMAVVQNRSNWERFRDEILVGLRTADVTYLERLRQKGFDLSFDVDSLAEAYDKPTLIVTGRQDASVGFDDAWHIINNYSRATFAVLDAAGHNAQIEQAEIFSGLVSEWLNRVQLEKELHIV
jgi:pimeloyl-ACP methyl ester carboxylesterase